MSSHPVLITGANGHLGRRLVLRLAGERPVRAAVRSQQAAAALAAHVGSRVEIAVIDYADEEAMARAASGCSAAVHLAGILKETHDNPYALAHEGTCRALVAGAMRGGLARIVCVSILGSRVDAANDCLASKGRAERLLLDGPVPATVLRVPMVLGEGDHASAALAASARRRIAVLLRAASREQPIYAGDVVAAIVAALDAAQALGIVELAGPESLTRRALVLRAAARLGCSPRIVSLPLGLGLAGAALLEALLRDPPITRAMLGVLDHDDAIDPEPAARALGIALTPLDAMLDRVLASR